MSYNTTGNNRIQKEAAWDMIPKFRRMRVSSWNNFWVFYTRFSKPRLKFLRQMLYGIQITKSVILNKIPLWMFGFLY